MKNTLEFLFKRTFKTGVDPERIQQKVCQDIFIKKLSSSDTFLKKVVFKGGIVMYELTNGLRGYTKDIDLDFIKYPISAEGVTLFIEELNKSTEYPEISIRISSTKEFRQKNYHGRRIELHFIDEKNTEFNLSVDVAVHLDKISLPKSIPYELKLNKDSVDIPIDSNNLSIVEKLSTFALYGTDNERVKDLFDVYWRIKDLEYDIQEIHQIYDTKLVYSGAFKRRNISIDKIIDTLKDKNYRKEILKEENWTKNSIEDICDFLIKFLHEKMRT